jgi:serine/threonine protein kinase
VIHRDLKPDNIMLGANHTPKLVDFGQSRNEALSRYMTANTRGSLLWRAPELSAASVPDGMSIARVSEYSTAVDVFSFGIVMWETWARAEVSV